MSLGRHIALVEIKERAFKFSKIPLDSVRTYLFENVSLKDSGIDPSQDEQVVAYLTEKVSHALQILFCPHRVLI